MKNIKIISVLVLFVMFAATFESCSKKGEDDPFLSFKSRDTRLAGDWTLVGVDASSTTTSINGTNNQTSTSTRSYTGGEETITSSSGSKSTKKYNVSLVIDKNGTIEYTYEGFDTKGVSTGVSTVKGTWNWETTGKRKSAINIDINGPSNVPLMGLWDVSQLKNKEIIFSQSQHVKSVNGPNSTEMVATLKLTFEGK